MKIMKKKSAKSKLAILLLIFFGVALLWPFNQEISAAPPSGHMSVNEADAERNRLEPFKNMCGENLDSSKGGYGKPDGNGPTPLAPHDDKAAVAGTVSWGIINTSVDDMPVGMEAQIDLEKIIIYLMSSDNTGSSGTVYCQDYLGGDGGYRFDGVYPRTYNIVVHQILEGSGFLDWVSARKASVCSLFSNRDACLTFDSSLPGIEHYRLTGKELAPKTIGQKLDLTDTASTGLAYGLPVLQIKDVSVLDYILPDMTSSGSFWLANVVDLFVSLIVNDLLIIRQLTNPAVQQGWEEVRNISNFLLIIILTIIAFANVLRVNLEAYTAKSLIPRLVIAGILINFSLLMTRAIIDLTNVLTVYLTQNTSFWGMFSFGEIVTAVTVLIVGGPAATLAMIIIQFIAFFAAGAVLLVLLARFVIIWICAIFSPLIFLFGILPFTRGLMGMWWKYLIKYAFIGPVVGLLMYVASHL